MSQYIIKWSAGGETVCTDLSSVVIEVSKVTAFYLSEHRTHYTRYYASHDEYLAKNPFAVVWPWNPKRK